MDLGSPENGFEELNDLLKDDDSNLAGELGLSFIVNKDENTSNYGFDNLASSNDFCVDVNEQGQQAPPSLPSDFPYYDFPEKFQSSLQTGFDSVVLCETKDERQLSPPKNYYQQEETEELCGSYLSTSPFQVESETLQHDIIAEVSGHLLTSPSRQDATQEVVMEDRPVSPPHVEMVQKTILDMSAPESAISAFANKLVEEEVLDLPVPAEILQSSPRSHVDNSETESGHIHHSRNSPVESRKLEMSLSPRRSSEVSPSPGRERHMLITVDRSPGSLKACSSQQSLGPHRQRQRSSPEMSDLGKKPTYERKNSASPWRSRESARHTVDSSLQRSSISPRNHHLHQNHRRRERSISKSPVRRKESSSRHKRMHHDRSRSRSPYKRDYHRRFPRRRHSPRRKSPPSDYHSNHRSPRRRSPRRRLWSPPHNRSTGLGKPGRNLFVAGFSFLTTERDLERKFSRFGRVRDVRIVRDKRSGDSRGFGFLTLEKDEEADAAIRALDKTEWNGRIVLVEKSKPH